MQFKAAQSITEQVAGHLASEIITGVRPSGGRIQELTLAKTLGVSRGSVREALLLLESRHLVQILPRRGAMVSQFGKEEILEFSEIYGDLQIKLFKSYANTAQGTRVPLDSALQNMEAAIAAAQAEPLLTATDEFACACMDSVNSLYLGSLLRNLLPVRLRLAFMASQHRDFDPRDALRYHRALQDAMRERNLERIEELAKAYSAREQALALNCTELHAR